MKVPLSPRLRACCDFVAKGDRVADVGTDHGYLGIWLLLEDRARSVIASDIVPGPLSAARKNAAKFGVADRMEFCLSDGVRSVPRDFDTLVCAGMGGDTMISIFSAAPWLRSEKYRLVLQCQSKTAQLRRYLSETGWRIAEETVLRDGRFLYTVMEVTWLPTYPRLTGGEFWFPPVLLENPGPETAEYFRRIYEGLTLAVQHGDIGEKAQALAYMNQLAKTPELQWLMEESK